MVNEKKTLKFVSVDNRSWRRYFLFCDVEISKRNDGNLIVFSWEYETTIVVSEKRVYTMYRSNTETF